MSEWKFALRDELEDDLSIVPPVFAAQLLERWIADPWHREDVIELVEELTGVGSLSLYQLTPRDLHLFVMPRLRRALMTGELVAIEPPRRALPRVQIERAEEPTRPAPAPTRSEEPKEPKEKELAWIDFRLIDRNGEPVPGRAWKIKLPDGTSREGVTGKDGRVRLRDVPEGTCEITFPDLAPDAWKVA